MEAAAGASLLQFLWQYDNSNRGISFENEYAFFDQAGDLFFSRVKNDFVGIINAVISTACVIFFLLVSVMLSLTLTTFYLREYNGGCQRVILGLSLMDFSLLRT